MKRAIFWFSLSIALVVGITSCSSAAPSQADWHALVEATWEGYKEHYIFCGAACGNNVGLVFDPNSDYHAVSEGVGYGLLMAVMMDDQETFDTIYDAAHDVLLDENSGLFGWRADNTGEMSEPNSATDADEDIAAALIFAQKRVERGEWTQHDSRPYGERANDLIDALLRHSVVNSRYLKPSNISSGRGQEITNLSYFAPAWYRIFDDFQGSNRWQRVIDQGYETLYTTQGSEFGLAPDWSTSEGEPAYRFCDQQGISREQCKYDMTYDAIRVPWRIGLDCLWFGEPRACEWSRRTANFLRQLPEEQFAQMYNMSGRPVVDYRNEVMAAMWLVAALAADDAELTQQLSTILYNYGSKVRTEGYWGDSAQFYYNQSLAWFGASLLSGDFRNLYEG